MLEPWHVGRRMARISYLKSEGRPWADCLSQFSRISWVSYARLMVWVRIPPLPINFGRGGLEAKKRVHHWQDALLCTTVHTQCVMGYMQRWKFIICKCMPQSLFLCYMSERYSQTHKSLTNLLKNTTYPFIFLTMREVGGGNTHTIIYVHIHTRGQFRIDSGGTQREPTQKGPVDHS